MQGLRFELLPALVQVDPLPAELQRLPVAAKGDHPHSENAGVEVTGCRDIAHSQNQVIDPVYPHRLPPVACSPSDSD